MPGERVPPERTLTLPSNPPPLRVEPPSVPPALTLVSEVTRPVTARRPPFTSVVPV